MGCDAVYSDTPYLLGRRVTSYSSTLKKEAAHFFKMSVHVYETLYTEQYSLVGERHWIMCIKSQKHYEGDPHTQ